MMTIATLERLEGYRVVRELGRVRARGACPRHPLHKMMLGVRALLGVATLDAVSEAERARRVSLTGLAARATELGAHAVIGVRFRIGNLRDGGTQVVALGRAVLLDPPLSEEVFDDCVG